MEAISYVQVITMPGWRCSAASCALGITRVRLALAVSNISRGPEGPRLVLQRAVASGLGVAGGQDVTVEQDQWSVGRADVGARATVDGV